MALVDWLREREPEQLVELLRVRPDLATPPPQDTRILAGRAGTRASVARACDHLDAFVLAVLEALVAANADAAPMGRAELAAWFGAAAPAARVDEALEKLVTLALAWGGDEISVVPAAREATGTFPGGLGREVEALHDADIPALLGELDEPELRLLHTLAEGPPIGRTKDAARLVPLEQATTPVQKLLARELLIRRDPETVELPRQVALTLRGDRPMGTVTVEEPLPTTKKLAQSTVDSTAAGEAGTLLRHLESIIGAWSRTPPPVLRSGGVGVRELRKLAKDLDVDEQRVALLVELLVGAGLVTDDEQQSPEWVPTNQADAWLHSPPEQRWFAIATAWLDLPRLPGLAGAKDERDKTLGPLTAELHRPLAPHTRYTVLRAIGEAAEGTALTDTEELVALLNWRTPRQAGRLRESVIRWTMAEANALGIAALGALSTAGRELLGTERESAVGAMAGAMPEPVDYVLVQADLTVVAPGPLQPELAAEMALVGDVESAGGATVYRVTESTARRALDAGRTAAELHALFQTRSKTPVPQSLTYLIDDVARRHGQLRGGAAGCFLRCDDPPVLTEMLAHKVAASLELRRIAESVVISPFSLIDVLSELREAGFTPTAEGPDGRVVDLRPSGRRIPARSRSRAGAPASSVPSEERLRTVVDNLRSADRAAATRRRSQVSVPAGTGGSASLSSTLAALRDAVNAQETVWIGLVDSRGTASQHVLRPTRIGGGVLEGEDTDSGDLRRLPLHLITTVALVDS